MDLLMHANSSALRYCEGGPFEITPAGVPASNTQKVIAQLANARTLLEYARAQDFFAASDPSAAASFRALDELTVARAPFEARIALFAKKHHDDLCDAWATTGSTFHEQFSAWLPLARKAFDDEAALVASFAAKAAPAALAAFEAALAKAKARVDDELAAANAVPVDARQARKAAKLAERERMKQELLDAADGGVAASKSAKKVRRRSAGSACDATTAKTSPSPPAGRQGRREGRARGCARRHARRAQD